MSAHGYSWEPTRISHLTGPIFYCCKSHDRPNCLANHNTDAYLGWLHEIHKHPYLFYSTTKFISSMMILLDLSSSLALSIFLYRSFFFSVMSVQIVLHCTHENWLYTCVSVLLHMPSQSHGRIWKDAKVGLDSSCQPMRYSDILHRKMCMLFWNAYYSYHKFVNDMCVCLRVCISFFFFFFAVFYTRSTLPEGDIHQIRNDFILISSQ